MSPEKKSKRGQGTFWQKKPTALLNIRKGEMSEEGKKAGEPTEEGKSVWGKFGIKNNKLVF